MEEDRIISKVNEYGLNRTANRDSMGDLSEVWCNYLSNVSREQQPLGGIASAL
jgi:hypothetical protein